MINKLNFEGYLDKITFKNEQVIKFTVVNRSDSKTKKIKATLFKTMDTRELFSGVEKLIGSLVVVVGEIYESNYKDKKTNEWINGYCVQVNKLISK